MAKEHLLQHGTLRTPQSEPMRADQVKNEAGGYAWEADKWSRLRRFLILGTEGGAYYVGERKLTTKNVEALRLCLAEDGTRTVNEIVEISQGGRAPKNDQALFALAYAISHGDKETKSLAAESLPSVARIGTHLYAFVAYAETMRGWGRTMRWAVSNWYDRNPEQLAYQAIKYRQRDGWSHRDLLRLAHPSNASESNAAIFDWLAKQSPVDEAVRGSSGMPEAIVGYAMAQNATSPQDTANYVRQFKLPREALKTEHLNSVEVWTAMLETGMPMTALIRNLATMTRNKTLDSTENLKLVLDQLADAEYIRKSRVHPLAVLIAMRTYASGRGYQSRGEGWVPKPKVTDALDAAFYTAFGNVEPTNKKLLLSVDVSGSMMGGQVGGSPLTPREAGVAMALVTLNVEPDVEVVGFDTSVYSTGLSSRQRLDDAMNAFPRTGNGTDTALPIAYAIDQDKQFEAFISFTDQQTWYGRRFHPAQAVVEYRKKSGINARNVTVMMVAYATQTNDSEDVGSLDVVGFDTATPGLISEFVAGKL